MPQASDTAQSDENKLTNAYAISHDNPANTANHNFEYMLSE